MRERGVALGLDLYQDLGIQDLEFGGAPSMRIIDALPFPLRVVISKSKSLSWMSGSVFWGLNQLDRELAAIIGKQDGYFVELGANDGISQSNTKYFELFRNWSGLLIEPEPKNFKKLRVTRKRKNVFVNAACVSFDFEKESILLKYSNLMTTPMEGLSDLQDREKHADRGRRFLRGKESVRDFYASARTLQSLLNEHSAPTRIDLLSLDVEGGELEVLQGVNHDQYRFSWLLVECRNFAQMHTFLKSKGYEFHERLSHHDYLFRDIFTES